MFNQNHGATAKPLGLDKNKARAALNNLKQQAERMAGVGSTVEGSYAENGNLNALMYSEAQKNY